jgi:methyl-accepting chemotaxis protein
VRKINKISLKLGILFLAVILLAESGSFISESIREVSDRLTFQFLMIGALSILLTAITVFFLTRVISLPLIRMKRATEKIITGNHTVSLDTNRKES